MWTHIRAACLSALLWVSIQHLRSVQIYASAPHLAGCGCDRRRSCLRGHCGLRIAAWPQHRRFRPGNVRWLHQRLHAQAARAGLCRRRLRSRRLLLRGCRLVGRSARRRVRRRIRQPRRQRLPLLQRRLLLCRLHALCVHLHRKYTSFKQISGQSDLRVIVQCLGVKQRNTPNDDQLACSKAERRTKQLYLYSHVLQETVIAGAPVTLPPPASACAPAPLPAVADPAQEVRYMSIALVALAASRSGEMLD